VQLFAFFTGQVHFVEDFRHGVIIPALLLRLFKHDCIPVSAGEEAKMGLSSFEDIKKQEKISSDAAANA
jgi:hypothetical protein